MPTLLNRTIRLFLDSIGRREEYEFYLSKFTSFDTPAFALICPDPSGFEETAQALAFDLDTLMRLELHPAIVLAGPESQDLRKTLLKGDHAFDLLDLNDVTSAHVSEAESFLRQCNATGKTGILSVAHAELCDALPRLVPTLARRIHLLRPQGPMKNADGSPVQHWYVNAADSPPPEDDADVLSLAADILEQHPGTHISVCSPWQLLQELFTIKGAGTIVRRRSVINRVTSADEIDETRLLDLFESAFRRPPIRDRIIPGMTHAYIEDAYRGAAVLEEHDAGIYLSKFAVGTEARGEGLSNELWSELSRDHNAIFWRSRAEQPFNHWYERRAMGYHTEGAWKIFWTAIEPNRIPEVIYDCMRRPSDFEGD